MSDLTTSQGTRTANALRRPALRAGLASLGLVRALVPLVAALFCAVLTEQQLASDVPAGARALYLATVAILAASAVDSAVCDITDRAHRRLYGRVHGARTWACDDCGTTISARHWTPAEAHVFEAHLSDPAAHNCPAAQ